ncbi:hypothetical protein J6590_056762 [Homalodisca vitripennis]|nr:hypothetical protein J6590_056762 [Homalodisca vitripennis]
MAHFPEISDGRQHIYIRGGRPPGNVYKYSISFAADRFGVPSVSSFWAVDPEGGGNIRNATNNADRPTPTTIGFPCPGQSARGQF